MKAKKRCDKCNKLTRGNWRAYGYYYCYKCYQKEVVHNENKRKTRKTMENKNKSL